MTTTRTTTETAAVPPPHKLKAHDYRATAAAAFTEGAREAKTRREWLKWTLLAILVRLTGFPRGYTNGHQVTIREDAPLDVYAHEYGHAVGLDHPSFHDVSRWFDVRAAHPFRWTDLDGLRARARAWLSGGGEP